MQIRTTRRLSSFELVLLRTTYRALLNTVEHNVSLKPAKCATESKQNTAEERED